MTKTIMVVDDEKRLVSLVESYLTQEGYRIVTAYNGREALTFAQREKPDLIVLDVMMPEMDGYEFMRRHRADNNTPIILLTARVDDEEKAIGLEIGADDYMTKPFRPRELVARVRAVLRRAGDKEPSAKVLKAADIVLDCESRTVKVGDGFVDLTPSEFDILTARLTCFYFWYNPVAFWRGRVVRFSAHAWRACLPKGNAGSNPALSAEKGTGFRASPFDSYGEGVVVASAVSSVGMILPAKITGPLSGTSAVRPSGMMGRPISDSPFGA